ncbi:MAG: hypothetical protein ACYS9Y_11290 [Planctomycetota bacterium]
MKIITMTALVLTLSLSGLTFTAGCSRPAGDCSNQNKLLRQTIEEQNKKMEEQKAEIERLEQVEKNYAMAVIKIVTEMDNAKKELAKARKEIKKLKKAARQQNANPPADDNGNKSDTSP